LLEGSDYLEFGIYRGFNLWYTQALSRAMGTRDMRFFGFDSFFGIPPVDGIDSDGPFHEGDFSAYRDEVEHWLKRYGGAQNQPVLVEGFFEKTLNAELMAKHSFRRAAFCVVDCDLYSSSKTVLDWVAPLLHEQTLLFFDDWDDFGDQDDKGEKKAFSEFCAKFSDRFSFEPFENLKAIGGKGIAFIVHRK
jgi:O-methyltransferase